MRRIFCYFSALLVAALWSGCQTDNAGMSSPPPSSAGLGSSASRGPASVPSTPPTPEQVAQLHAAGVSDPTIGALVASGQVATVVTQIQTGVLAGAAVNAAMANAQMSQVVMSPPPMAMGPSSPPSPPPGGFGGGNLGGFGGFPSGLSGGGGGGGGGQRAKPPRTENLTAAVNLWKTSTPLDESFGQYTYVLLSPDDAGPNKAAARERNLMLLRAALVRNPTVAAIDEEFHTAHEKLNVVLIPMKTAVSADRPRDEAFFAAVLDGYNWTFAAVMRTALKFEGQRGPFLYSAAEQWDRKATTSPECIKQDLSGAPDSMVLVWWGEFLKQSSRPDFWQKDKMQQVALTLREYIEKAAEQAGESQAAVKSILALIGLPAGGK